MLEEKAQAIDSLIADMEKQSCQKIAQTEREE